MALTAFTSRLGRGQGRLLTSKATGGDYAFVLGEEIVNSDALDKRFCEKVDLKRNDRVLGASRWTNLFLTPPSPELMQVIGTMSQDRAMCDEFTDNFNRPEVQWNRLASPQRMLAWLAERQAARSTVAA